MSIAHRQSGKAHTEYQSGGDRLWTDQYHRSAAKSSIPPL